MLKVPFYRSSNFAEELVGYIILHNNKLSVLPNDASSLKALLQRPAVDAKGEAHYPSVDPEEWMKALASTYRGSYFWAGDAEES